MPINLKSPWQFTRRWAPRVLGALLAASLLFLGAASLVVLVILRRQGDIPPMGEQFTAIGALALGAAVIFALWWVPRRQAIAIAGDVSPRDRAEFVDRYRRTLIGILAGVGVVFVLGRALGTAREIEQGALAERLSQATAQLASEHLIVRIAGVHLLEELARSSDALHRPAYETLVLFAREGGRRGEGRESFPPDADVMAAVAAVSRRTADGDPGPLRPDFSGANLRGLVAPNAQLDFSRLRGVRLEGADLRNARIAGAYGVDLRGVRLDSANLSGAHLDGAWLTDGATLMRANLQHADLDGATLDDADLRYARLDNAELNGVGLRRARLDSASLQGSRLNGATFAGASLVGTDFSGARLDDANLMGTDLSAARNLTDAQLAVARTDSTTILPLGRARQTAVPAQ